jgi:hypothetical protein
MRRAILSVVITLSIHSALQAQSISSVTIGPDPVLSTQNWFIIVQGTRPGSVGFEGTDFIRDGTNLRFNINFVQGVGIPELIPYSFTTPEAPLPPDTYTLDVRTFLGDPAVERDRRVVQFTVVPEPTAGGMALALLMLLQPRRRRRLT